MCCVITKCSLLWCIVSTCSSVCLMQSCAVLYHAPLMMDGWVTCDMWSVCTQAYTWSLLNEKFSFYFHLSLDLFLQIRAWPQQTKNQREGRVMRPKVQNLGLFRCKQLCNMLIFEVYKLMRGSLHCDCSKNDVWIFIISTNVIITIIEKNNTNVMLGIKYP